MNVEGTHILLLPGSFGLKTHLSNLSNHDCHYFNVCVVSSLFCSMFLSLLCTVESDDVSVTRPSEVLFLTCGRAEQRNAGKLSHRAINRNRAGALLTHSGALRQNVLPSSGVQCKAEQSSCSVDCKDVKYFYFRQPSDEP